MMKADRHDKILELVLAKTIGTQEELLRELQKAGVSVTQATVSRDIKELGLVKELDANGRSHYITSAKRAVEAVTGQFGPIFYQSVRGVDYAGNTVVIKCHTGTAGGACATLDAAGWDGMVGTIAGDDTIFVLMRTDEAAASFTREIYRAIRP